MKEGKVVRLFEGRCIYDYCHEINYLISAAHEIQSSQNNNYFDSTGR